ncbi:MAG: hypothetical protein EA367_01490 [Leptolyngbya sp. DLM2.Bin15]|nr:MAG: hypothetical protein EA367_01490 [Leptolyngbya sp. DLM2.Bin15]
MFKFFLFQGHKFEGSAWRSCIPGWGRGLYRGVHLYSIGLICYALFPFSEVCSTDASSCKGLGCWFAVAAEGCPAADGGGGDGAGAGGSDGAGADAGSGGSDVDDRANGCFGRG